MYRDCSFQTNKSEIIFKEVLGNLKFSHSRSFHSLRCLDQTLNERWQVHRC